MLFRVRSTEARVLRISSTSQHYDRLKSMEFSTSQTPSSNPRALMMTRVGSVIPEILRRLFSLQSSSCSTSSRIDIKSLVDGVIEDDGTRHRIQGIAVEDLGVFYHGFAQALVSQLDRAQVSCIILSFVCRICIIADLIDFQCNTYAESDVF